MSNYTLDVISHHPTFKGKSLRQYHVDGINNVGAWGNEPFEIRFKNNTYQKVQVKISVDGTDVLTGKPATTDPDKGMWVVNAYGTLSLKAWPETNNGGAQFIFTSANNSVAIHTHGDLSSRGIIAAAVFTEGHVEPPVRVERHDYHHYPYYPYSITSPIWIGGGTFGGTTYTSTTGSLSLTTPVVCNNAVPTASNYFSDAQPTKSLEGLVAAGAGQYVDQHISYVAGLIEPQLADTVRIKYMWWDDLVSKLRSNNVPMPHASGFPGDKNQTNINLGKTPRIGEYSGPAFPRNATPFQSYLRV